MIELGIYSEASPRCNAVPQGTFTLYYFSFVKRKSLFYFCLPRSEASEGYMFTGVFHSFCRLEGGGGVDGLVIGGCVGLWPGQGGWMPHNTCPLFIKPTPNRAPTPLPLWSMHERYASYSNAYLLKNICIRY